MADTAIGVLGLAGLFKVTLEVWDFVDAGRDFSKNFNYLRTRLDNQRAIFLIWAERMGFDSPEGYTKELDNPIVSRPVENTLLHLRRLFSDTDDLSQTYGVKISKSTPVLMSMAHIGLILANLGPEPNQPAFRHRYAQFMASVSDRHRGEPSTQMHQRALRRQQKEATLWQVNKWAIRDEKKFEKLITKVEALVQDLKNVTESIPARKRTEDIARQMVDELNEEQLPHIEQAGRDGSASVLSSAASHRLRAIEARTISTATDQLSRMTFVTARTQPDPMPQVLNETPVAAETTQILDFAQLDHANVEACGNVTLDSGENLAPFARKRITSELQRDMGVHDENRWWTLRPIDDRLDRLLGTIKGPSDTPYQGGIFHVRLNLEPTYPMKAPRAWFLTKILHPNVDQNGAICVDTLDDWTPIMRLTKVLISLASLLDDPNWEEPVSGEHLAPFVGNRLAFEAEARRWTRLYATGIIINPGDDPSGFSNTTGNA
ncbi:prion-inhibition and propagation domain-containing protein [Sarocladium implicatum]|nr:prion-inhibition and propagation domain-containing protein [Sarocladium implicatum]